MFQPVDASFGQDVSENVFAGLQNKTMAQTLAAPRYAPLMKIISQRHMAKFDKPIGSALLKIKEEGDPVYKRFLNPYGDLIYSRFRVVDKSIFSKIGLYRFTLGGEVVYIGRCRDGFGSRFNSGYGMISPKNCYRDGQATNCRINALVTEMTGQIGIEVSPMEDLIEIENRERELIQSLRPKWNIALAQF